MIAMLMCALVLAAADEPEPATKAPPPTILLASVKDDHLVSRVAVTAYKAVAVTRKVKVGDKEVEVTTQEFVPEMRTVEVKRDLSKATFNTAGGKKLTLEDAKKRLAKVQPVVLSSDGKAVDEAYLKVFDKDALVIVMPQAKIGVAPPPPPPPPLPKKE